LTFPIGFKCLIIDPSLQSCMHASLGGDTPGISRDACGCRHGWVGGCRLGLLPWALWGQRENITNFLDYSPYLLWAQTSQSSSDTYAGWFL
jgi:hypothetical protein